MTDREKREQVLEVLENLKDCYANLGESAKLYQILRLRYDGISLDKIVDALDFAISSIKTDIKYDLLYESSKEVEEE